MAFLYIIISLAIILSDRITKLWAKSSLMDGGSVGVIPNIFSFEYAENTGAAFSILSDKTYILGIISAVFCVGIIIYWIKFRPKNTLLCTALALVFSGALGNGIDRVFYGYVIDFIRTDFIRFPIFNIADIAITFGAILLVIYVMFFDRESK